MFGAILGGIAAIGACSYFHNKRVEKKQKTQYYGYVSSQPSNSNHSQRRSSSYQVKRNSSYDRPSNRSNSNRSQISRSSSNVTSRPNYNKKVEFYDLYREVDNHLGRLNGNKDGGGVTKMISGCRNKNINSRDVTKWTVLRSYRNKLSHDKAKWKDVGDPNPEAVRFMKESYKDMKSNPNKYRNMMKESYKPRELPHHNSNQNRSHSNNSNRSYSYSSNRSSYNNRNSYRKSYGECYR